MAKKKKAEVEEIPAGQIWFDKTFFWLGISIAITALMYTVWGLIEVLNVPAAP